MGSNLLREQGIHPHTLAEQMIRANESTVRPTLRNTPYMLYDTDVLPQRNENHYRELRAQPSRRTVQSFKDLQARMPAAHQKDMDKHLAFQADMRVAHRRPLVYKQAPSTYVGSTR